MNKLQFKLLGQSGKARLGKLTLSGKNGEVFEVETPQFMPVGTCGSVKGLTGEDLRKCGAQIILGNTYHLYLRPGHERVERLGELAQFMHWDGPILTDSGGFQVFSLSKLNKIEDQGVTFKSHWDGSSHFFSPQKSMEIQKALGSQIVMAFDECPPYPCSLEVLERALRRTKQWAYQGFEVELKPYQARFGIVQGGLSPSHREQSIRDLIDLPFDGFAIGGLSVGEEPQEMQKMAGFVAQNLPEQKPRYLMGVGRPEDLVAGVAAGIDLFDCVMPTRNARNGQLFTSQGRINIKNACFSDDDSKLDPQCACETCSHYSKAYLRHLLVSKELLFFRLASIHNLAFYLHLMREMRAAIQRGDFQKWQETFSRQQKLTVQ